MIYFLKQMIINRSAISLVLFKAQLFLLISILFVPQFLSAEDINSFNIARTDDFSQMAERKEIRALVVYNKMFYFLDKGVKRGVSHDMLKEFETFINKKLKTGTLKVRVIFIPVSRDRLLPLLVEGKGDIAVANLTITDDRKKIIAFSDPFQTKIDEILVTGSSSPTLKTLDDLSGKEMYVRTSSSYHTSLLKLNDSFKKRKLKPVKIIPAGLYLEDSDLLEMVNNGSLPYAIVDNNKAEFWVDIFENLTLHPELKLNQGGKIAWAFRKNSPELAAMVNEFAKDHKKGTKLGNIINTRYLKKNTWSRNATAPEELEAIQNTLDIVKHYAGMYKIDYMLILALAYQESRFDNKKKSHTGALGFMQVLPSTAADPKINITHVEKFENNVHAGVKYLNFVHNRYFKKSKIDKLNQMLFSLAAYNAGPARVASLRKEAAESGLNPDEWFNEVEVIAARRIGRETVQYVSNIYKYYLSYRLISSNLENKERDKQKFLKE